MAARVTRAPAELLDQRSLPGSHGDTAADPAPVARRADERTAQKMTSLRTVFQKRGGGVLVNDDGIEVAIGIVVGQRHTSAHLLAGKERASRRAAVVPP